MSRSAWGEYARALRLRDVVREMSARARGSKFDIEGMGGAGGRNNCLALPRTRERIKNKKSEELEWTPRRAFVVGSAPSARLHTCTRSLRYIKNNESSSYSLRMNEWMFVSRVSPRIFRRRRPSQHTENTCLLFDPAYGDPPTRGMAFLAPSTLASMRATTGR